MQDRNAGEVARWGVLFALLRWDTSDPNSDAKQRWMSVLERIKPQVLHAHCIQKCSVHSGVL